MQARCESVELTALFAPDENIRPSKSFLLLFNETLFYVDKVSWYDKSRSKTTVR